MLDPRVIAANLARVREQVGPTVEILAATKYVEEAELGALAEAGVTLLGENRSDTLIAKQQRWLGQFTWDFIGHVQSRKVKDLVGRVRLIHAVDSLSVCRQIQARAGQPVACLLQVNVSGEGSKSGIAPAGLEWFLADVTLLDRLVFHGLMTMPPLAADAELARPYFAALRELRERLAPHWQGRHPFTHLSMGTSQDYRVAAEEGATIVRVGSVLYGR